MEAPFRGKGCLVCGGEVMHYQGRESKAKAYDVARYKWLEDSPAGKLLEAKREEWTAEIEAVELPANIRYRYLPEHDVSKAIGSAQEHFRERRIKHSFVRVEHRPSVDEILNGRWKD